MQLDLFEAPCVAPPPVPRRIGYAARPGTGPKGQRCNTCISSQRVTNCGCHSWKCERMAVLWVRGEASDIKPGAPACSEWERKPYPKISSKSYHDSETQDRGPDGFGAE